MDATGRKAPEDHSKQVYQCNNDDLVEMEHWPHPEVQHLPMSLRLGNPAGHSLVLALTLELTKNNQSDGGTSGSHNWNTESEST